MKFTEKLRQEKEVLAKIKRRNSMGIVAPNPTFNTSLNLAHPLLDAIVAASISVNPRLYANDSGGPKFYPETDAQNNDDMPAWVQLGNSLESSGQDPDQPIYLQVWIVERQNFYDVAQVQRLVANGVALDVALS